MLQCNPCLLVRHTLALMLIAAILTNPLWLLLLTTQLSVTWLQVFGLTIILQFNLAAAQQFQKINYFSKGNALN